MSFQLIYTSAPQLLEVGQTGYGTVARSQGMPVALAKKVSQLSGYKENHPIQGAQYSYRIINVASKTYHLLSCIQMAGCDHTGRDCHIAHHLILTKEEIQSLRANHAPITPAGLILRLTTEEFWKESWQDAPTRDLPEPDLEDTSELQTYQAQAWQELTGNQEQSLAFSTPPYEYDCLVIIPKEIHSHQILELLHESDCHDKAKAWGKTFTSHGEAKDAFADTQRIFVIEGSPLEARALRTGRPILRIHKQPEIAPTEANTPPLAALLSTASTPEAATPAVQPPKVDKPRPRPALQGVSHIPPVPASTRKLRRHQKTPPLKALVLTLSCVIGTMACLALYHSLQTISSEQQDSPPLVSQTEPIAPSKPQATALAQTEIQNFSLPPTKRKVQSPSPSTPKSPNSFASIAGGKIPKDFQNLLRQAPLSFDAGYIKIYQEDKAMLHALLQEDKRTLHIESLEEEGHFKLSLSPSKSNGKTIELTLKTENNLQNFKSITLEDKEICTLLKVEHKGQKYMQVFVPQFKKAITLRPMEAQDNFINIQLKEGDINIKESQEEENIAQLSLDKRLQKNFPWADISINIPLEGETHLFLPNFPEIGPNVCINTNYHATDEQVAVSHFRWRPRQLTVFNPNLSIFALNIERQIGYGKVLDESFARYVNASNNKPFYTLATLYTILIRLELESDVDTRQKLIDRYFDLFTNMKFARKVQNILGSELTLTQAQAYYHHPLSLRKRTEITRQLRNPDIRRSMRDDICYAISEELMRDYLQATKEEKLRPSPQHMELILQDVSIHHGKIYWLFQLQAPLKP